MSGLKQFLPRLALGETLSEADAELAFNIIMSGEASAAQMGAFLMALRMRGETIEEITAAARIMRAKATQVCAPEGAIDTCGTGGDASGTYNISTAAALVTAACGVVVAKHGNKAMSSKSGSADVLAALGVNLEAEMAHVEDAIRDVGIGFLMAPRHHSAMRHVGPVRMELGTRTIFNLLGPLANPAGAARQLLGVYSRQWVEPIAIVLGKLGSKRAMVVHGSDGLDEITTTGPTHVGEYHNGAVSTYTITPEDVGLPLASADDLKGGDAAHNAAALTALLKGAHGPYRDIVLFNTSASLMVADKVATLRDGVAMAAAAIDDGRAWDTLQRLIAVTQRSAQEV
ncbi:anthranilate phosphoribosyltransferase [Insolitispirillum peregrinum]|uniref:anthranilate phosphoribosyltransferase n=1 Tax=Insolitispirillum peregrinum TaxID=80876 RepID=UPI0036135464